LREFGVEQLSKLVIFASFDNLKDKLWVDFLREFGVE